MMGSTNDNITQALTRLFERHRIIFWHDAKQELREEFEALSLDGVEKLELDNNEFGIKYRILREQPTQKFLLYRSGSQPLDLENWLLDVQLAHGECRSDQGAIWLAELELGSEFTEIMREHAEFFRAGKRRSALKKLLNPDDNAGQVRFKMVAACAGSEPRMDAVLENLLQELADGDDDRSKLLGRCNLGEFFHEQLDRSYSYQSEEPGIRDFAVELFKSCYAMGTNGQAALNGDALVFLKRWKDSIRFAGSFETLSEACAEVLGIEQDLAGRDFRDVLDLDYFRLIDQKIISDLIEAVSARTVSGIDVSQWVRHRKQCHWYDEFRHLYEATDYAARFIHALGEASLEMGSLAEGVERYSSAWYQIDQLYRKYIFHAHKSGEVSLLGELTDQVENLYSNNYLLKLNDRFQVFVDGVSKWDAPPVSGQKDFFERWVRPFLRKDNKVCVIISDALRYEIGAELLSLVRQEDRYHAELKPALAMLPSYTQLGMAALLPNKALAIADNETGAVLVDGQDSRGTTNRAKILKAALDGRGEAITSEDFMGMNREAARELLKANHVVYLYHNRIDHTGDKMRSEGQAFEAAEQTLEDLIKLVKKLTSANASNILVTADHGFIYQHRELAESDFSSKEARGETICYRDRRFVLGKRLEASASLRKFTPEQLGLAGRMEVQIPKSINRLRLRGSGSRFVHGGAALQEVVVPVIRVNKKRQSDVSVVEVDILPGASSMITAGQLTVTLYQAEPVTDKVQARVLRAGIYTESQKLISDKHELRFDLASDNSRERELQVSFVLTREADKANGQEVILKLEEKHVGTSHYQDYKSQRYQLRRSFTSDFEF